MFGGVHAVFFLILNEKDLYLCLLVNIRWEPWQKSHIFRLNMKVQPAGRETEPNASNDMWFLDFVRLQA